IIDRQFDGTITPLAIAFVVCNSVAWLGWRWAVARTQAGERRSAAEVASSVGEGEQLGCDPEP
ncbi:MAG TPA: hypothetical protein VE487_18620, partial [Ilumatobacter sp.]|nr:hypothetical protein [Ilumatobacter sp.]